MFAFRQPLSEGRHVTFFYKFGFFWKWQYFDLKRHCGKELFDPHLLLQFHGQELIETSDTLNIFQNVNDMDFSLYLSLRLALT